MEGWQEEGFRKDFSSFVTTDSLAGINLVLSDLNMVAHPFLITFREALCPKDFSFLTSPQRGPHFQHTDPSDILISK